MPALGNEEVVFLPQERIEKVKIIKIVNFEINLCISFILKRKLSSKINPLLADDTKIYKP